MLYASILEYFVDCLNQKQQCKFDGDFIKKVLGSSDTPLFIFDPTKSVDGLVNSLSILWGHRNRELDEIKAFKLRNLNILQGKKSTQNSIWVTLLAYCGGFYNGRPCGNTPLVIGLDRCSPCMYGRLICPECGYCCQKCEEERAKELNEQDVVF